MRLALPLALLLACADAPASPPVAPPVAPSGGEEGVRVVAVGDLHGDLDNALAALRLAGIVDEAGAWTGGRAVLVQTGDTTDRGPDSRDVLDLIRRLEREARAAGGRVVPLLGNHEAMNLLGDLRYVHPGDYERFGGADERARALALDGEYGAWLAGLDAVAVVGDTVFCHGGVHPQWAARGLDAVNAQVRAGLRDGGAPVLGETGPLWLRALVELPEAEACPLVEQSVLALGARRMVVGHTTRRDGRIQSRCGGRLAVIDTGISDHYGGNLAAWELVAGDARALYAAGPVDLPDP